MKKENCAIFPRNIRMVIKPREMIKKTYFHNELKNTSLPLSVMKLRDFILSEIYEKEAFTITLNVEQYYREAGIETLSGKHHQMLCEALEQLRTIPTPIVVLDPERKMYHTIVDSWVDVYAASAYMDRRWPCEYTIKCKENITQALLADTNTIAIPHEYARRLGSKYSYILRDYLIESEMFDTPLTLSLMELAALTDTMSYLDGKRSYLKEVIEPMVKDINEYAMDIEIFKYQMNKEGKKYTSVTFWVRRIINPINIHEFVVNDEKDNEALDLVRNQICADQLYCMVDDRKKVELAVRVISAAHQILNLSDTSFAHKFDLTNEQMKNALFAIDKDQVYRGLQTAYQKKRKQKNLEIYILQCILNAKPKELTVSANVSPHEKDPSYSGISPIDFEQDEVLNMDDPVPVVSPLKSMRKKQEYLVRLEDAKAEVNKFIQENSLIQRLCSSAMFSEEQNEFIKSMINHFMNGLYGIFSSPLPMVRMGKETISVSYVKSMIAQYITLDVARNVIERVISGYDKIRYKNPKTIESYLMKTLWNELLQNPAPWEPDLEED